LAKRKLAVDNVKPYVREIKTKPVTFVCALCLQQRTEERYPGPTPKYCLVCKGNGTYTEHRHQKIADNQRKRRNGE
jgi:hypothetical protein